MHLALNWNESIAEPMLDGTAVFRYDPCGQGSVTPESIRAHRFTRIVGLFNRGDTTS